MDEKVIQELINALEVISKGYHDADMELLRLVTTLIDKVNRLETEIEELKLLTKKG